MVVFFCCFCFVRNVHQSWKNPIGFLEDFYGNPKRIAQNPSGRFQGSPKNLDTILEIVNRIWERDSRNPKWVFGSFRSIKSRKKNKRKRILNESWDHRKGIFGLFQQIFWKKMKKNERKEKETEAIRTRGAPKNPRKNLTAAQKALKNPKKSLRRFRGTTKISK